MKVEYGSGEGRLQANSTGAGLTHNERETADASGICPPVKERNKIDKTEGVGKIREEIKRLILDEQTHCIISHESFRVTYLADQIFQLLGLGEGEIPAVIIWPPKKRPDLVFPPEYYEDTG